MKFYEGFSWAVPRAFGAAVSACRFELGDVLYDDTSAYGSASDVAHHVQVLEPARSNRSVMSESEGQRFFANWETPVRFEWRDYAARQTVVRSSTQGRLFTCLWRGDATVLEEEGDHAPEPPRLLRELAGQVEAAIPALRKSLRLGPRAKPTHLFAFATDQASDASRTKAAAIVGSLVAHFRCRHVDLRPEDAGIEDGNRFHPALAVRGVAITAESGEPVHATLKGLLYRGAAGTGEEEGAETSPDRFKLARHGLLIDLAES